MIISIASGKGGTGKTTVATNLAVSLESDVQVLDCDVEEPNSHLFIRPVIEEVKTISTPVPEVDMEKCSLCGKCGEICQFKAIVVIGETVLPFHELCHSCGGCVAVCPEDAITETGRELGVTEAGGLIAGTVKSSFALGTLFHEGIGDTFRISLTRDPVEEIRVCYELLRALHIRHRGPELISCPTCGRCEIDVVKMLTEIELTDEQKQKINDALFNRILEGIKHMERAVNFARRHRALGMGFTGWHSYLL